MTRYEMENWNKWASRSAEKKRIAAQQAAVRPFLRPVQFKLPPEAAWLKK